MQPVIFIYGLKDLADQIRYVGQTYNLESTEVRHRKDLNKRFVTWRMVVLQRTTESKANAREKFHYQKHRQRGGCDLNGPRFIPSRRPPRWQTNKRLLRKANADFLLIHPTPKPT